MDLKHVRLAVNMLTSLRSYVEQPVYSEEFEEPFLAATRNYYEKEAAEYIASYSATDFLKQVHKTRTCGSRRGSLLPHSATGRLRSEGRGLGRFGSA